MSGATPSSAKAKREESIGQKVGKLHRFVVTDEAVELAEFIRNHLPVSVPFGKQRGGFLDKIPDGSNVASLDVVRDSLSHRVDQFV
jgi:hypothetical protein